MNIILRFLVVFYCIKCTKLLLKYSSLIYCYRNYARQLGVVSNWMSRQWLQIRQKLDLNVCWVEHPPRCTVLLPLIRHHHCAGDLLTEEIVIWILKGNSYLRFVMFIIYKIIKTNNYKFWYKCLKDN